MSELVSAASRGDLVRVRELLVDGAPLNDALFAAARNERLEVVRLLLEHGADPNSQLATACFNAQLSIIELLLASGADPNAKRALFSAQNSRNPAGVLALLVNGGIDANARCEEFDTPVLTMVCSVGDLATAQKLLDRGADPNARGKKLPLSEAQASGNQVLVDLLFERGARPLTSSLPAEATAALDAAEAEARAHPTDPRARLAWAEVLLAWGFRAAAASELFALQRLGVTDARLTAQLSFAGWTFVPFVPAQEGVAPRTTDERFPGARVTDGERTLPLLLTMGPRCTRCDDRGEEACEACRGTGTAQLFDPAEDGNCNPRQTCSSCRGFKFTLVTHHLGKGSCKHPRVADEMMLGHTNFRRCQSCGLAALFGGYGQYVPTGNEFACGVCGRFSCVCGLTPP